MQAFAFWATHNLATRRNVVAVRVLKGRGCCFLFLPPYNPDLSPIEVAISKLKAHLHKIEARTFHQLFEAIGDICDMFSPQEC
jgi:transposase